MGVISLQTQENSMNSVEFEAELLPQSRHTTKLTDLGKGARAKLVILFQTRENSSNSLEFEAEYKPVRPDWAICVNFVSWGHCGSNFVSNSREFDAFSRV